MRTPAITLMLVGLVSLVGCGPSNTPGGTASGATTGSGKATAADLGKLGFALAGYEDGFKKGPASASDLKAFMDSNPQDQAAYRRVADGDIVVLWGTSTKGQKSGPAATVAAYARDVPTAGGLVLYGSGEVRTLTAAEFAAAPKAVKP